MSRGNESQPTSDQALDREAERALRPFRALIPAEEYEAFLEIARWHLDTDPVVSRLVKAVCASPVVYESGDVDAVTGKPVEAPAAPGATRPTGGAR